MFDIGAPELLVLIIGAVLIFGPDKLPEFIKKAANVLRYVRGMASNAQGQLSKELGPEFSNFDFRDLNPKQFVQKHLFSDVEPLVADVKNELTGVAAAGTAAAATVKDSVNAKAGTTTATKAVSAGGPVAVLAKATPFDPDAT